MILGNRMTRTQYLTFVLQWSAFVIDKIQSLYQGRPAALQAEDCQVPIVFLDEYEELEQWSPFAYTSNSDFIGSPSYSVSTFAELCRLCVILNSILNKVYSQRSEECPSANLTEHLKSLDTDLRSWSDSLPSHLRLEFGGFLGPSSVPPPHVLSLM
jgi:hypothetical protein